ncbi:unnamed protein product [Prorocentrum cordatum]|uniref:Cytochrome c oxidase assembly factor 5 n=1 Tax=Prorocentrum cordatum TaxID=2364126 RepID=A0ABN9PSL1_9DINO|nr:unnamed protein product [Polarella glacialis]
MFDAHAERSGFARSAAERATGPSDWLGRRPAYACRQKEPWLPPGSFALDASKPHWKASNSCLRIKNDMLQCYESSPCYKSGAPFEECLNSNDEEYVTPECLWLRKGYSQCRRDLLNRNRIWQRGNRAT